MSVSVLCVWKKKCRPICRLFNALNISIGHSRICQTFYVAEVKNKLVHLSCSHIKEFARCHLSLFTNSWSLVVISGYGCFVTFIHTSHPAICRFALKYLSSVETSLTQCPFCFALMNISPAIQTAEF